MVSPMIAPTGVLFPLLTASAFSAEGVASVDCWMFMLAIEMKVNCWLLTLAETCLGLSEVEVGANAELLILDSRLDVGVVLL